jgi:sterol 14-demethylase
VLLASNAEWKARCREEIDGAVAKHRTSAVQCPSDILDTLTLEEWEAEFPVVDACLREAIRVAMPGAVFRKNTSGSDIAIGKSKTGAAAVIPSGSYATYLTDDVHMDPAIYPDPHTFNPGRYLRVHHNGDSAAAAGPRKKEEEPHSYVGWGSGLHPCRK